MDLKQFLPRQFIFCDMIRELAEMQKEIAIVFKDLTINFNNFEVLAQEARNIEHKADEKTYEVVNRLNTTFIIPFDREDIYKLAHNIDSIVDVIENVIHNIYLYKITEKKSALIDFADIIEDSAETLVDLTLCLRDHKYTERLKQLKIKMHELEDKADYVYQQAMVHLFTNGDNPVDIIKWKDIFSDLEQVTDRYQRVSDNIEEIMVKFS
ncbi:MAG: DUF47 family protein [Patescibacteria group bacterium]|nr:DUF47 family protein [Patescibacteria group bacterium]MDD4610464.1 DUF47 family protein [Patescibacteria group bacterium]